MAYFDGLPQKQYVPWCPNAAVVKFFEDMARRRVPATQQVSLRITDTSPPTSAQYTAKSKHATPRAAAPSASDRIRRTAQAQLHFKTGSATKSRNRASTARKCSAPATTGTVGNGQPAKHRKCSTRKRKNGKNTGSAATLSALERRLKKVKL